MRKRWSGTRSRTDVRFTRWIAITYVVVPLAVLVFCLWVGLARG